MTPFVGARHRFACPMRWGDMDSQDHINNAAYLDYLQEARVDFLLRGPAPLQQLLGTGVLVVSHQVEYLRPVKYSEEPLRIELWVDAIGGSRFVIGYDVFNAGELAARARTAAVPFDLAAGRLRRLTADERALLTPWLTPAEPLPELPSAALTAAAHRSPLSVRWSDLDSYGHVNNVKFFDYVQESRIQVMLASLPWEAEDVWLVVRQDIDYRRPMDFRTEPYQVATQVTAVGNRSFRLAAEVRDPAADVTFASARTVVVGASPLTAEMKVALGRWADWATPVLAKVAP